MAELNELISVIVTIYQVGSYLEKCIEGILDQTYTNLEIILVNDGSTDCCPDICDKYKAKDNRIKVIHKPNGGLVSARKTGLLASTGKLIGYVDGDDWIEPDFYKCLFEAQHESNADIVADGFCRDIQDLSERITNSIEVGTYRGERLKNEVYPKMLCTGFDSSFGIYSYVWNKLFRKEVLFESQMNVDERIVTGEDVACTYPALLKAESLCVIEKCHYHYVQRAGSMLKTIDNFEDENIRLQVLSDYLGIVFKNSEYKDVLIPQLDDYMRGIRLIRGDSYCRMGKCCYPFNGFSKDKRVGIYSAGTFGQNLFARMKAKKCCQIVGVYDPDYAQYQQQGLDVKAVNEINADDFDLLIIASLNGQFINESIRCLSDKGISNSKILTVLAEGEQCIRTS